jgi:hypothetical protein
LLDHTIEIEERQPKQLGEHFAHGGFAAAHEADEENMHVSGSMR